MANIIYLTVKGMKQGLISAGCSSLDSIGNKYQAGHEDQILVYSFTHSITRAQNANHGPINIIKPIDKSSPLFGVAISENEVMDLSLDFYRTSQSGGQEKYYSIAVTGAALSRIDVNYPHSLTHDDNQPEEMLSFTYKNITWTHHKTGTSGYSIWEERVF